MKTKERFFCHIFYFRIYEPVLNCKVVYGLISTQTRGYYFFFQSMQNSYTHSCTEQAAGSYSRPGNIHEFFPFSRRRYFINALLESPDPFSSLRLTRTQRSMLQKTTFHLILYEENLYVLLGLLTIFM